MARTRRRGWRIRTVGTTLAAALLLALPATAAHAAPGDATSYLVDAAHTSSQPAGGPTGTLTPRWTADLGGSARYAVTGGGRVFAVALRGSYGPGLTSLRALDAATGRPLWTRRFGDNDLNVALDGGDLYVQDSAFLLDLDAVTGRTRWIAEGSLRGPVVAADGVAVTLVGDSIGHLFGRGLAAADGHVLWTTGEVDLAAPSISDGRAYFRGYSIGSSSHVTAVDLHTGAPAWTSPPFAGDGDGAALSVRGGSVFVTPARADAPRGQVLDAATGALGPALDADFAPATDADGGLYAVATGTLAARAAAAPTAPPRWTFGGDGGLAGTPLLAGGRVWVGSELGKLYGLNTLTGATEATLTLPGAFDGARGDDDLCCSVHSRQAALSAGDGLLLVPAGSSLVAFSGADPVAGAAAPATASFPDTSGSQDAPDERQDPQRSGLADGAPAPPLAERWVRGGGLGTTHAVIVGDRALLVDMTASVTTLSAVSLADGHTLWERPVDLIPTWDGLHPHLAADATRVYVADPRGPVTAYSLADGSALWQGKGENSNANDPDIAVSGDTVYAGGSDGVVALDAATGARRWGTGHVSGAAPFALDDDTLFVGDACGRSEAIARATGDDVWPPAQPSPCNSGGEASPFVSGGRVFGLGPAGGVRDARSGALVDRVPADSAGHGMYVSAYSTRIEGVRPDGPLLWSTDVGFGSVFQPLISRDHVYAAGSGTLSVLSRADGRVEWSGATPWGQLTYWGQMIAGRGVLLEVGYDGVSAWATAPADAPAVTFTAVPEQPVRDASAASVAFTVPAGASASCAVDGGAYAPCASPWTPPAVLDEGEHLLHVRASASGPVASTRVVVDRTGSEVTVLSAPPLRNNDDSGEISFRADGPATFTCAVDGGTPAPCTSPYAFRIVSEGTHTVALRATDAAGNLGPIRTQSWVRDWTRPVVRITRFPYTVRGPVQISWTVDDPTAVVKCRLDGDDWQQPCSSPVTVQQSDTTGEHDFSVEATDAAGNWGDDRTEWQWTDGTDPYPYLGDVTADRATQTTRFSIGRSPAGAAAVPTQCRIDDGAWTSCADGWAVPGLREGHHVARIRNASTGLGGPTREFETDWAPPSRTIRSGPPATTTATGVFFDFYSADSTYAAVRCTVDGASSEGCGAYAADGGPLPPGPHVLRATFTDNYGGTSSLSYAWTQLPAPDRPVVSVKSAPVDGTTDTTATFHLGFQGSGAAVRCRVDDEPWDEQCDREIKEFTDLSVGPHVAEFLMDGQATPTIVRWTIADPPPPPTGVTAAPHDDATVTLSFSTQPGLRAWCAVEATGTPCSAPSHDVPVNADGFRHTGEVWSLDCYGTSSATPGTVLFTEPDTDVVAQNPQEDGEHLYAPGDYGCENAVPAGGEAGTPGDTTPPSDGGDPGDGGGSTTTPPDTGSSGDTTPTDSTGSTPTSGDPLPTGQLTAPTVTQPAAEPAPPAATMPQPQPADPARAPTTPVVAVSTRPVTNARLSVLLDRALRRATVARTASAVTLRLVAPGSGTLRLVLLRGTTSLGRGHATARRGRAVAVRVVLTAAGRRAGSKATMSLRAQLASRGGLPAEARRSVAARR